MIWDHSDNLYEEFFTEKNIWKKYMGDKKTTWENI